MSNQNTQLIDIHTYNAKKQMIFSDPESGSVPESIPKIEYKRINISSRNLDGSIGELMIPTSRLFSFGLSENLNQQTNKVTGYTLPLCLWDRNAPTEDQKQWVTKFEEMVEACIEHLVDNRDDIDQEELTHEELRKAKGGLNPLYWKREKITDGSGKTKLVKVEGQGPTLYAKLIFSKKDEKFKSQLYDMNDCILDPFELKGKYCYVTAAIKFESIFISGTGKISLQIKVSEANVEPAQNNTVRLLARPAANPDVQAPPSGSPELKPSAATPALDTTSLEKGLDSDDDRNSIEETPVVRKPVKKAVAKKGK